jgi:hypothetical protein
MKNTVISRSVLILPIVLGLAMTAKASPVADLILTEVSSTTLQYTWNGVVQTVTDTTPDNWTINLEGVEIVTGLGGIQNVNVYWKEPDYASSGLVNYVNFYQYDGNGTTITVASDAAQSQGYPLEDNGEVYTFPVSGGNTVVFNDNGDTVPDGGATVALLGLGLLALSAFRQKLAR